MDTMKRVALAQRLEEAEVAVQQAYADMDGSPASWTVLESARRTYREAEAEAVVTLGAQEALALVESRLTRPDFWLVG